MNSVAKTPVLVAVALIALCASQSSQQQQLAGWGQPLNQPQQAILPSLQQDPQQYGSARQPIVADLQNQVNALGAQIAAANRQLQYFQQQLSLVGPQPKQPELPQPANQEISPLAQNLALQQQQQQQQLLTQQQQQQLVAQQQFFELQPPATAQQLPAQPQAQQPAQVSTLVDEAAELAADPRYAAHQPTRISYFQPQAQQPSQAAFQPQTSQQQFAAQVEQQQQQQAQQAKQQQEQQLQQQFASRQATSTTVGPPSLETSLAAQQEPARQAELSQQEQQPQQLAPPANMAPPHNPPKNDDKFSIGLGVLSPGYTQKFGNTALDFNQDKNGFSFTLSNNGHNNQLPATQQKPPSGASASDAQQ